jgi:peptidoglycan/xylan/chitin deacetylase (PgdA/CDA1 family)
VNKENQVDFFLTNDVERHSFETNSLDDRIVKVIENNTLPKLLQLYKKYKISATFFFTAYFAQLSPKSVLLVKKNGHEIACHGYNHLDFYDEMNLIQQTEFLKKSKDIIENISNSKIVSFRAPALRINRYTVQALEKTGFKFDSSVASQRFDGPFTTGAINKLKWLTATRNPYYMSYNNPFKNGPSSIIEVPISSFIWPFIGTHMRLSPFITKNIQKILMFESKHTGKPLVFLIHPNEFIEFNKGKTAKRNNVISDYLRHSLKMKNLGNNAFNLLESVITLNNKKFNFKKISRIKL